MLLHGLPWAAAHCISLLCSHWQCCPPAHPCTAELQAALEDGKLALKAREARIQELEAAAAAADESASEAQVGGSLTWSLGRGGRVGPRQAGVRATGSTRTPCTRALSAPLLPSPCPLQALKAKVYQLTFQLSSSRDSEAQLQVGSPSSLPQGQQSLCCS